jgi:hypothetical protein
MLMKNIQSSFKKYKMRIIEIHTSNFPISVSPNLYEQPQIATKQASIYLDKFAP